MHAKLPGSKTILKETSCEIMIVSKRETERERERERAEEQKRNAFLFNFLNACSIKSINNLKSQ